MFHNYTGQYEEDIQQVLEPEPGEGALFISNKEAAENPATLARFRITAVLSAAKGLLLSHPNSAVPLYKYVPAEDHEGYNLSVHFEEAGQFIKEGRRRGNVLVHCMAGVSRSVTLVLAYLIRHKGLTYEQAYARVKRARPIISPNSGFIQQLRKYALQLTRGQQRPLTGYGSPTSHYGDISLAQYYSNLASRRLDYLKESRSLQASPQKSSYQLLLDKYSANPVPRNSINDSTLSFLNNKYGTIDRGSKWYDLKTSTLGLEQLLQTKLGDADKLSRSGVRIGQPDNQFESRYESRFNLPGRRFGEQYGIRFDPRLDNRLSPGTNLDYGSMLDGRTGSQDAMSLKIEQLRRKYLPQQASRFRTVSGLTEGSRWH